MTRYKIPSILESSNMSKIRNLIPKPQRIPVTEPRTTPGRIKGPAAIDYIVNQNTVGQFASPPFPSSKGAPWAQPSGDPRAAVTGAARREELIQKRKAKRPVKGSITKSVKTPIEGPKTKDVSDVDDFFGAGSAPMGYKYGSRK
jgi:hypothetical protein